jgi:hypothetical protein
MSHHYRFGTGVVVLAAALLGAGLAAPARAQAPRKKTPEEPTADQIVFCLKEAERLRLEALAKAPRFDIKIDARTPLQDLLPVPPRQTAWAALLETDELTLVPGLRGSLFLQVPEIHFQEPEVFTKVAPTKQLQFIARQLAGAHHVNKDKRDGFLEAVLSQRRDLDGMAFAKGDACRLTGDYRLEFARAVRVTHSALARYDSAHEGGFAEALQAAIRDEAIRETVLEKRQSAAGRPEDVNRARIAALMQLVVVEPVPLQREVVQYLAGTAQDEATLALARLAIFPYQDEVRHDALEALAKRASRAADGLLMEGLRYPHPAVAQNAAAAVARLKRTGLVPQLVAFLDEPDPAAPVKAGARGWAVRELVRTNHHRNCLLCHGPASSAEEMPRGLTGPIPAPGLELPGGPLTYYAAPSPDVLVRADVTYLRQDFTLMLPVENAKPWPEEQRFDFLVRTRALTGPEVAAYEKTAKKRGPGYLSPNHRAALDALRQLTGRDAGPSAAAWRRELARR